MEEREQMERKVEENFSLGLAPLQFQLGIASPPDNLVLVQTRGLPAMETLTFEAVMKDKSLDGQPQLFKEESNLALSNDIQAGSSEERSRVVSHEKREWVTKDSFQGGSHGRGRNAAGKQELNSSAWKRRQEGTIKCVQLGASLCLARVTDCMEDPHTDTLQQLCPWIVQLLKSPGSP
ncbi:unnamed protein product [Sphagnum compactum]